VEDQIIGRTSEKERVTEKGKEKVPNDTILIENEKRIKFGRSCGEQCYCISYR